MFCAVDIFVDQRDLLKIVVDRGSTERVQDHTASEEVSGNAVTSTSGRDNINAIMHYRKPLLEQEDVHEKRDIYVESKIAFRVLGFIRPIVSYLLRLYR